MKENINKKKESAINTKKEIFESVKWLSYPHLYSTIIEVPPLPSLLIAD